MTGATRHLYFLVYISSSITITIHSQHKQITKNKNTIEIELVVCEFAFDSCDFEIELVEIDATVNEFVFDVFVFGIEILEVEFDFFEVDP